MIVGIIISYLCNWCHSALLCHLLSIGCCSSGQLLQHPHVIIYLLLLVVVELLLFVLVNQPCCLSEPLETLKKWLTLIPYAQTNQQFMIITLILFSKLIFVCAYIQKINILQLMLKNETKKENYHLVNLVQVTSHTVQVPTYFILGPLTSQAKIKISKSNSSRTMLHMNIKFCMWFHWSIFQTFYGLCQVPSYNSHNQLYQ